MSRVLAAVEEVFKLAVLDNNDLRADHSYDVFCIYPKGCYTYLGEKEILTLEEHRVWNSVASFLVHNIKVGVTDMSHLHLFLPTSSKQQILEAFRSSQFSAAIVKEALDYLYSGKTLEIG